VKGFLLASTCKVVCLMPLAFALLSGSPAQAQTIWTVTSTADSATDTTTLRGAVNAAADRDIIDFQVTGTIVLTLGEIGINKNLSIHGPGASQLAISGNNTSRVFHIQFGSSGPIDVEIDSLTIENGNGNISSSVPDDNGGAIRTVENLLVTACVFVNNSATTYGGAIYVFPGVFASLGDNTFSNNSATYGGAFYSDATSSGAIAQSTFTNNSASIAGGAIYLNSAGYDFNNNSLLNNIAGSATTLGSGAGIYVGGGSTMHMQHDVFSGNTIASTTEAGLAGGSGITNLGTLTIETTTISSNSGNVGSIWNGGTLNVGDVTIAGNDTAIFNSATADFDWVTVAHNSTYGIVNAGGATLSLQNTLLSDNPFANCLNDGTINSLDFNLSDDATCAAVLTQPGDLPPLTFAGLDILGLQNNGGPINDTGLTTQTIALKPGSKAVNAITDPANCVNIPPFGASDERGISRPQGTGCDIGAYEATPDFYITPIPVFFATVGGAGSTPFPVNSFVEFSAPVSLATSPATSGLTASFSADPVTPPVDGTVSPTLTVNVGPSVTPGTYSFSVVGVSGLLTHSVQLNLSVQTTAASVTQVITDVRALGCIDNGGISNALSSKLAAAQAAMNAGNIQDAMDSLNDFMSQLHAQAGKHISTSCTDGQGNQFNPVEVLGTDVGALQAAL
jgi:predicted outer membrane repeat protein